MSAFGRRNGPGGLGSGNRPAFGNAKPMKGTNTPRPSNPEGGEQFPPIPDEDTASGEGSSSPTPTPAPSGNNRHADARRRLDERSNAVHVKEEVTGFEASVHKIKEQVLPRLLERIDPEAASTLTKEELGEEFRPIIMEVLAELKVTLNRREQFALEKVLIDEL
ncbi:MAG: CpaF family protein, partial [Alteriqipengyuania sp.]